MVSSAGVIRANKLTDHTIGSVQRCPAKVGKWSPRDDNFV